MSKTFRHIKNGKRYKIIKRYDLDAFKIKQETTNEWEAPIFYYDLKTYKTYVTGEKRFKEKFVEVDNEKIRC